MASSFWFIAAISASIMWGLGYVLTEIILKAPSITPLFLATITTVITAPIFIGLSLYYGDLSKGMSGLSESQQLIPIVILIAFTILGGTFLVYMSVAEKNAVLTSIIESTYPIFAVVFGFLILKDFQINLWTAIGMFLTFTGISIVLLKSH